MKRDNSAPVFTVGHTIALPLGRYHPRVREFPFHISPIPGPAVPGLFQKLRMSVNAFLGPSYLHFCDRSPVLYVHPIRDVDVEPCRRRFHAVYLAWEEGLLCSFVRIPLWWSMAWVCGWMVEDLAGLFLSFFLQVVGFGDWMTGCINLVSGYF
ncbi:hypothetical protein M413DRAFT_350025 [Hebeloma cylindrosporum]|uniref:Uncharacterized protein n=1 Tax=Hebeloma cylindrosporum TaxID=76867 RepID=A0A0C3BVD3_HEBCY|nr:hypothetical protein M413DRAFT_350025 [Hebeloma cylindrosporum h7]